jgi:hypothetical protein
MKWRLIHSIVALLLATNYCAFQIEPFEEEYEANHPPAPDSPVFSQPTITWESFDKQNAPKAFVFDAAIQIQFLFSLPSQHFRFLLPCPQHQLVRDKSPPLA